MSASKTGTFSANCRDNGYSGQDARANESTAEAAYDAAREVAKAIGEHRPLVFRVGMWGAGYLETSSGERVATDDPRVLAHIEFRSPSGDDV